ncbi:MAG: phosphoribosylamine--glycine ligase [Pyrinomonadaceae bacterium]
MKVLVVGSGGREHAIVWALKHTARPPLELYCAPGNAGIAEVAKCIPISAADHSALVDLIRAEAINLTVVGPEGPLADGIVDKFQSLGIAIAGPSEAASRLEASKSFAKDFMARHGIPTAKYKVAHSAEEVGEVLRSGEFGSPDTPVVIKADGLAAGKGVVVASSHEEALQAAGELAAGELINREAARRIVIEETLLGTEVSLLLFADGRDYALMPAARDHKRIGENDTGPNTGGMGAITDSAVLNAEMLERVVQTIVEPTLAGARADGFPFCGVLFLGLMLTDEGPRLLEYNVRFGDPETQAILVRLKTSLLDVFEAIRTGRLADLKVEWSNESSACVVLASSGYPGKYDKGKAINGLEALRTEEKVNVFHAGTERSEAGEFVTAGGRVLGVTATGANLQEALRLCYNAAQSISWPGVQYRRDIGKFRGARGTAGIR